MTVEDAEGMVDTMIEIEGGLDSNLCVLKFLFYDALYVLRYLHIINKLYF